MIRARTAAILGLLTVVLMVAMVWSATRSKSPDDAFLPPLDTHSTNRNGGRALQDYLKELGYPTDQLAYRSWELPDDLRVLFLLAPNEPIAPAQIQALGRWLESGGRLVFAARSSSGGAYAGFGTRPGDALLEALGLESAPVADDASVRVRLPLLNPPVRELALRPRWTVGPLTTTPKGGETRIEGAGVLTAVVAARDSAVVGFVPVGRGGVWVSADGEWLANERIGEAEHGRLLMNMLAGLPPGATARVWFDEWHHGYYAHEASFGDQLTDSAWGRSLIAAFLLAWLYLALSGRRFGRAVPVRAADPRQRRSTGELVTSLAHIFRRAGQRDWALRTSLEQSCARLASLLGLNPAQSPPALVEALDRTGRLKHETIADLRRLVERAARGAPTESELEQAGRTLADIERRAREGTA